MHPLSPQQKIVVSIIVHHIQRTGVMPSAKEISAAMDRHISTIYFHIEALRYKGILAPELYAGMKLRMDDRRVKMMRNA